MLKEVGIQDFVNAKIFTLSGGEQQRVAIAKVLLKDCDIILDDEPTGSLETDIRDEILNLLMKIKK